MKTGAAALTAILLLVAAGAAQAESPSAHAIAEGRYHLRKANGLAGDDRCQAAIHEYTLAYKKLGDPVVLFNRAECYRRIGEDEKAVADYRAFLEAVPAAPNRAQIEAEDRCARTPSCRLSLGLRPRARAARGRERSTAPPPVRPIAAASPPPPTERPTSRRSPMPPPAPLRPRPRRPR